MWERDGVTDAITHVLDQARRAKGDALFVIGEAGLGKTSLLELARRGAGPDFWIGTSVGDPAKAVEPFRFLRAAIGEIDEIDEVDDPHDLTGSPDRVTPFTRCFAGSSGWIVPRCSSSTTAIGRTRTLSTSSCSSANGSRQRPSR